MTADAYFRASAGAIITNAEKRILVMRRRGAVDGKWQMPQGGIRQDETPEQACFRELREETGLQPGELEVVARASEWLAYEVPAQYRNPKIGWGQVQAWFLLRLRDARAEVRPDEMEFDGYDWFSAAQLLQGAAPFRLPVYRRLVAMYADFLA